jgi:hypothetical protein
MLIDENGVPYKDTKDIVHNIQQVPTKGEAVVINNSYFVGLQQAMKDKDNRRRVFNVTQVTWDMLATDMNIPGTLISQPEAFVTLRYTGKMIE